MAYLTVGGWAGITITVTLSGGRYSQHLLRHGGGGGAGGAQEQHQHESAHPQQHHQHNRPLQRGDGARSRLHPPSASREARLGWRGLDCHLAVTGSVHYQSDQCLPLPPHPHQAAGGGGWGPGLTGRHRRVRCLRCERRQTFVNLTFLCFSIILTRRCRAGTPGLARSSRLT